MITNLSTYTISRFTHEGDEANFIDGALINSSIEGMVLSDNSHYPKGTYGIHLPEDTYVIQGTGSNTAITEVFTDYKQISIIAPANSKRIIDVWKKDVDVDLVLNSKSPFQIIYEMPLGNVFISVNNSRRIVTYEIDTGIVINGVYTPAEIEGEIPNRTLDYLPNFDLKVEFEGRTFKYTLSNLSDYEQILISLTQKGVYGDVDGDNNFEKEIISFE